MAGAAMDVHAGTEREAIRAAGSVDRPWTLEPSSLAAQPPRRDAAPGATLAKSAVLAAEDSQAFRIVCEILMGVICAGLVMMVATVWWIVS